MNPPWSTESFHQFLIDAAVGRPLNCAPWRDIGMDLQRDDKAPRGDKDLYAYLCKAINVENIVENAWFEYLKARAS